VLEIFRFYTYIYAALYQGDQMIERICQNFQKVAKTVANSKKAKISISKPILKVVNIYNKPLSNLKIPTTNHVLKLPT